jgi:hypothetical protein
MWKLGQQRWWVREPQQLQLLLGQQQLGRNQQHMDNQRVQRMEDRRHKGSQHIQHTHHMGVQQGRHMEQQFVQRWQQPLRSKE